MKLLNTETLISHTIDQVLNIDGKKVYFTNDGFCFPEEIVKVVDSDSPTQQIYNDDESFSDEQVSNWIEKNWIRDKEKYDQLRYEKEKLGLFFHLFKVKLKGKIYRFWFEDNSKLPEYAITKGKKIIFKLKKRNIFFTIHS